VLRSLRLSSSTVSDPTETSSATERLLEALRRGDPGAQARFFDAYVGIVERVLLRVFGPDSELEDLVQESFLQALTSLHRFRGDASNLTAWVRAVAVRTAQKRIRGRQVRRRTGLQSPEQFWDLPSAIDPATQAALASAQRIIAAMPLEHRMVFSLRFVEGLELREIAECVGLSLATVKRRLQSAREIFESEADMDALLHGWLQEGHDERRG